jgi:hypothetical protein
VELKRCERETRQAIAEIRFRDAGGVKDRSWRLNASIPDQAHTRKLFPSQRGGGKLARKYKNELSYFIIHTFPLANGPLSGLHYRTFIYTFHPSIFKS